MGKEPEVKDELTPEELALVLEISACFARLERRWRLTPVAERKPPKPKPDPYPEEQLRLY